MDIIEQNTQTAKSQLIRKIRPNLYQLPQGQLVGFGPLESENGTSTCWTCFEPECIHVKAVAQAWLDGMSVEAQSFTLNGYHADAVPAPPIAQTKVTQADIDCVERGNKPGAWRAKSIEEMPSGWTRTVIL